MPSFSYQLIKLILKLKGTKKRWSQSPVDYRKLRQEDICQPTKRMITGSSVDKRSIHNTTVTELTPPKSTSDYLLLYCPGGAFVYGPTELNWRFIADLSKKTQTKAWLLDYPKAPENTIVETCNSIDTVYQAAIEQYDPSRIILVGDSVGGNLLFSLVQRLIRAGKEVPPCLIAVTPVADASMTNPDIEPLDKVDPILSKPGVLSAKEMCAGEVDLKDPVISPLYGSFESFPRTYLFVATHDILYPDQKLLIEKMKDQRVKIEVVEGEGMPHIWPLLPVLTEATEATAQIAKIISTTTPDYQHKT